MPIGRRTSADKRQLISGDGENKLKFWENFKATKLSYNTIRIKSYNNTHFIFLLEQDQKLQYFFEIMNCNV